MQITKLVQMLTIRERLAIGYGLLIFILLAGGGFTLYSLYKINDSQKQIVLSVATATEGVSAMVRAQEAERLALEWAYPVLGEKGALSAYMLADDDKQRKALFAEFADYGDRIKSIGEQIAVNLVSEEAKRQIVAIKDLQDRIRDAAIDVIATFDGEAEYGSDTKNKMAVFSGLVDKLVADIRDFQDRNSKEVQGFKASADGAVKAVSALVKSADDGISASIRSNMLLALVGVVLAVMIAYLMYRSIIQPLGRASRVAARIASYDLREDGKDGEGQGAGRDEISKLLSDLASMRKSLAKLMAQVMGLVTNVSEACAELTSAARMVEGSSQKQLEYVKDSTASTSQMSIMAGDLAKTATEAATCSAEADSVARKSVEKDAKHTLEIIGTVEKEVEAAHAQIRTLWEAAGKVSTILTVINDIADQTNLLALNAAIEAARAGEQGRGFAVVADEVSSLARRVGQSAKDIEALIQTIKEQTQAAMASMDVGTRDVDTGSQLVTSTLTGLGQLITVVKDTAHAVQEQAVVSDEIARNMDTVQHIATEVLTGSEESVVQAERLHELAYQLEQSIGGFNLDGSRVGAARQDERRQLLHKEAKQLPPRVKREG